MRGILPMLVVIGAVCSSAAFASGVYKWTDADGRVHFGDRPPADAAAEEVKIYSYEGPAEVETAPVAHRGYQGVVMYSTDWCKVCKSAKAHLKKRRVVFTEFDIEKNGLAKAEFKRMGGRGVPLILVGDKRMKGFSATRLDKLLQDAGLIAPPGG
jgi:glutaredoxin